MPALEALEVRRVLSESLVVTTTVDENNGTSDPASGTGTSLREAINYAAGTAGAETITFSGLFNTPQTITLGSTVALTAMNGGIAIAGPGVKKLTITGAPGLFDLRTNTDTFALRDVTLGSQATPGGDAVHAVDASASLERTTVTRRAHAVFAVRSDIEILDSAIVQNTGERGAIAASGGQLTIRNSTISGNSSTGPTYAGGVYSNSAKLVIENSTVTGNTGFAGGLYVVANSTTLTATIRNTIVAGNIQAASPLPPSTDIFLNTGSTLTAQSCLIGDPAFAGGIANGTNGNIVGKDDGAGGRTLLPFSEIAAALADNGGPTPTHALLSTGPATNKGDNALIPAGLTNDQRGTGFLRIGGTRVDIGAFEYQTAESLVVTTTADEDDGTSDPAFGAGTSLREALAYAARTPGDETITFSSLFDAPQTITLGSEIGINGNLNGAVTIAGPGAKLLNVTSAGTVFSISSEADKLTINDVTIGTAGATPNFPGVAAAGAVVELNRSVVTGRSVAVLGGGSTILLADSTFTGNGHAIDTNQGNLTIRNSTISGNATPTTYAGGVNAVGTVVRIEDSTVAKNAGATYGGVLFAFGAAGSLTVYNSLIAGNLGPAGGTSDLNVSGAGTITAANNLIGDPAFAGGIVNGADGNIVGKDDGAGGRTLLPFAEVAAALADNGGPTPTHALVKLGPAVNKGDNALIPAGLTTDQRGAGFPRIGGTRVDIGAFEAALSESLVVTTTADEDDGTSDPAFGTGTSLREALAYATATPGDETITFSSLFDTPQTITLADGLSLTGIDGDVTIDGPGAKKLTVTGGGFHLFNVSGNGAATVTINDVTLGTAGVTLPFGRGISVSGGGTVNLNRSVVTGRSGGVIIGSGAATITDSAIVGNTENNSTAVAGGVGALGAILTIRNSTISGNAATTSSLNGGVYVQGSTVTIENSTITGNSGGSALRILGGAPPTLNNNLIAGNPANDLSITGTSSVSAHNNLVGRAATTAVTNGVDGNIVGKDDGAGGRIDLPFSEIAAALADNGGPTPTHALLGTSPAINKGSDALLPADVTDADGDGDTGEPIPFDQRGIGFPRKVGTVDIGAFESTNVAPSITSLNASPNPAGEGADVTLSGSFTDAGDTGAHAVTITWGDGSPNTVLTVPAGALTFSTAHPFADGAAGGTTYSIGVTVADVGGESDADSTSVTVNNVAPTPGLASPPTILLGASSSFTFSANDPSSADRATGFKYVIDWGDGSALQTINATPDNGNPGVSVSHAFNKLGPVTVTVRATDKDGATSTATTFSLVVSGAKVQTDPAEASKKALVVYGTNGDDALIDVDAGKKGGTVDVKLNGALLGTFKEKDYSRIVIFAMNGNDHVSVSPKVKTDAFVFGGDGNDTVKGGSGRDVLVGGFGADTLSGRLGNDILIGGGDADSLTGDDGEDLLIGGRTSYDDSPSKLLKLNKEWSSSGSYTKRRDNVRQGKGNASGTPLNDGNVFDDGAVDTLTGGNSRDLFFAQLDGGAANDVFTDRKKDEDQFDID